MVSDATLIEHANQAVRAYDRVRSQYYKCAGKVQDMLTGLLDEEQINYQSVSARAKTRESFKRKAARPALDDQTQPKYSDPMSAITDLMGARVITYLPESVDRVCDVVSREFAVHEHQDKGQLTKERGHFGYASKHFLVKLNPDRAKLSEYAVLRDKVFEIQVRTAAQHAWAEFEHDVRYKVAIPPDRKPEFDRRFLLAAALVELADAEFTAIEAMFKELAIDTSQQERSHPTTVRNLNRESLLNWLTERYPGAAKAKPEHYTWMLGILEALDLTEARKLEGMLATVDSEAVATALGNRLSTGQVRRLDDDLLAALGEDYVRRQPELSDRRRSKLDARLSLVRGSDRRS